MTKTNIAEEKISSFYVDYLGADRYAPLVSLVEQQNLSYKIIDASEIPDLVRGAINLLTTKLVNSQIKTGLSNVISGTLAPTPAFISPPGYGKTHTIKDTLSKLEQAGVIAGFVQHDMMVHDPLLSPFGVSFLTDIEGPTPEQQKIISGVTSSLIDRYLLTFIPIDASKKYKNLLGDVFKRKNEKGMTITSMASTKVIQLIDELYESLVSHDVKELDEIEKNVLISYFNSVAKALVLEFIRNLGLQKVNGIEQKLGIGLDTLTQGLSIALLYQFIKIAALIKYLGKSEDYKNVLYEAIISNIAFSCIRLLKYLISKLDHKTILSMEKNIISLLNQVLHVLYTNQDINDKILEVTSGATNTDDMITIRVKSRTIDTQDKNILMLNLDDFIARIGYNGDNLSDITELASFIVPFAKEQNKFLFVLSNVVYKKMVSGKITEEEEQVYSRNESDENYEKYYVEYNNIKKKKFKKEFSSITGATISDLPNDILDGADILRFALSQGLRALAFDLARFDAPDVQHTTVREACYNAVKLNFSVLRMLMDDSHVEDILSMTLAMVGIQRSDNKPKKALRLVFPEKVESLIEKANAAYQQWVTNPTSNPPIFAIFLDEFFHLLSKENAAVIAKVWDGLANRSDKFPPNVLLILAGNAPTSEFLQVLIQGRGGGDISLDSIVAFFKRLSLHLVSPDYTYLSDKSFNQVLYDVNNADELSQYQDAIKKYISNEVDKSFKEKSIDSFVQAIARQVTSFSNLKDDYDFYSAVYVPRKITYMSKKPEAKKQSDILLSHIVRFVTKPNDSYALNSNELKKLYEEIKNIISNIQSGINVNDKLEYQKYMIQSFLSFYNLKVAQSSQIFLIPMMAESIRHIIRATEMALKVLLEERRLFLSSIFYSVPDGTTVTTPILDIINILKNGSDFTDLGKLKDFVYIFSQVTAVQYLSALLSSPVLRQNINSYADETIKDISQYMPMLFKSEKLQEGDDKLYGIDPQDNVYYFYSFKVSDFEYKMGYSTQYNKFYLVCPETQYITPNNFVKIAQEIARLIRNLMYISRGGSEALGVLDPYFQKELFPRLTSYSIRDINTYVSNFIISIDRYFASVAKIHFFIEKLKQKPEYKEKLEAELRTFGPLIYGTAENTEWIFKLTQLNSNSLKHFSDMPFNKYYSYDLVSMIRSAFEDSEGYELPSIYGNNRIDDIAKQISGPDIARERVVAAYKLFIKPFHTLSVPKYFSYIEKVKEINNIANNLISITSGTDLKTFYEDNIASMHNLYAGKEVIERYILPSNYTIMQNIGLNIYDAKMHGESALLYTPIIDENVVQYLIDIQSGIKGSNKDDTTLNELIEKIKDINNREQLKNELIDFIGKIKKAFGVVNYNEYNKANFYILVRILLSLSYIYNMIERLDKISRKSEDEETTRGNRKQDLEGALEDVLKAASPFIFSMVMHEVEPKIIEKGSNVDLEDIVKSFISKAKAYIGTDIYSVLLGQSLENTLYRMTDGNVQKYIDEYIKENQNDDSLVKAIKQYYLDIIERGIVVVILNRPNISPESITGALAAIELLGVTSGVYMFYRDIITNAEEVEFEEIQFADSIISSIKEFASKLALNFANIGSSATNINASISNIVGLMFAPERRENNRAIISYPAGIMYTRKSIGGRSKIKFIHCVDALPLSNKLRKKELTYYDINPVSGNIEYVEHVFEENNRQLGFLSAKDYYVVPFLSNIIQLIMHNIFFLSINLEAQGQNYSIIAKNASYLYLLYYTYKYYDGLTSKAEGEGDSPSFVLGKLRAKLPTFLLLLYLAEMAMQNETANNILSSVMSKYNVFIEQKLENDVFLGTQQVFRQGADNIELYNQIVKGLSGEVAGKALENLQKEIVEKQINQEEKPFSVRYIHNLNIIRKLFSEISNIKALRCEYSTIAEIIFSTSYKK